MSVGAGVDASEGVIERRGVEVRGGVVEEDGGGLDRGGEREGVCCEALAGEDCGDEEGGEGVLGIVPGTVRGKGRALVGNGTGSAKHLVYKKKKERKKERKVVCVPILGRC